MVINREEIGRRLKQLRIDKGYTQEQVSEEINMSRSVISNIECGIRLNIDTVISLCDLYDVSLDYIIPISSYSDGKSKAYLDRKIELELRRASTSTKEIVLKMLEFFNSKYNTKEE